MGGAAEIGAPAGDSRHPLSGKGPAPEGLAEESFSFADLSSSGHRYAWTAPPFFEIRKSQEY